MIESLSRVEAYSPHLALLVAQVVSSVNAILSRAAFSQPHQTVVPSPLTFAVWRAVIAVITLFFVRACFFRGGGSTQQLQVDSSSSPKSPETTTGTAKKLHLSLGQQQHAASFSFSSPAPPPTIPQIMEICGLGFVVMTGNFTMYFFGVAMTNAVTLSSMMCTLPPICFILGYAMGLETFTVEKLAATILVFVGNLIMSRAWIVFDAPVSASAPGHGLDSGAAHMLASHHHHHHQNQNHLTFSHASSSGSTDGAESDGLSSSTPAHTDDGRQFITGVFCLFIGFVCYALYLLLQRKILSGGSIFAAGGENKRLPVHILDFLFWLYLAAFGGLMTVSVAFAGSYGDGVLRQAADVSAFAWLAMIFSGCVHSTLTYCLIGFGTLKSSSLLAALYGGLQPLFIVLEAYAFLGEKLAGHQVIGAMVVLLGWSLSIAAVVKDQQQQQQQQLQLQP